MSTLRAEAAVYGGYVIAREGGVVFIKGAIPGELVDIEIVEKKRDYSVAVVREVLEPSDARIEPGCEYFGRCGGCQMQYMTYERQLSLKAEVLLDCLKRIGGMERALDAPTLSGPDFGYRLRAQWKVSKEGAIGFYREGTREVVPIKSCPLLDSAVSDATARLRGIEGAKELHVTCGVDGAELLIKGKSFDDALAGRLVADCGFSTVGFDDGAYLGPGFIKLDMQGLTYSVSPWSFFQSNWGMNREIVRMMLDVLGPVEGWRVLDLYAGAGNFSIPLAAAGAKVVAVEENPHSIRDGMRNIAANSLVDFQFVEGSAEKSKFKGSFDLMVLDPPRAGLTNAAMVRVADIAPARITYISCNPSTFSRDLKKLSEGYEIDSIRIADFFPQTYHIESVAFLTKKGTGTPSAA